MDNLFDLTGKRALITGSSRGLGLVFAQALANRGCHVVLNGRDKANLDAAEADLRRDGHSVGSVVFDVADGPEVAAAIEIIESTGPLDILVNNAGLQFRTPLEEFPEEQWQAILNVNLTGPFVVAKYVAQRMIGRRSGKIVNICSLQSDLGRSTIAPYAASKGGLKMLTRAMAVEWAKYNIQVNAIGPGYFATEMTTALVEDKEFDGWLRKRTPAGRWGDPEELIGALVLFSTSASDFINGQILYVDGGITAAI